MNQTYVIDSDITLDGDTTLPANVTLIFQGGRIVSNSTVTLSGNHTRLVAPICQIFGDKVSVEGTWDIDRAYPQWFNCETYAEHVNYHSTFIPADAGLAINRAIKMKQKGEVFLPKGIYVIITPIYVSVGIKLIGERGMDPDTKNPPGTNLNFQGTVLQSWRTSQSGSISDEDDLFMIYVNTIPGTTNSCTNINGSDYKSCQITEISSLCLYNNICIPESILVDTAQAVQSQTTACMGGVFSNEIVKLDHIRFSNFRRAVVYAQKYTDTKSITNCDYVCDGKTVNDNSINIYGLLDCSVYGFDFGDMGDSSLFSHNTINNLRYTKALLLRQSGGGLISCNIINGDISIRSCKDIILDCNHIEGGHQISIYKSNVSLRNNYIEKRYVPSIRVVNTTETYSSVVSLDNNTFIFYDEVRDQSAVSASDYYNNICQWDILIDKFTILNINNTYRQRIKKGQFSEPLLFGIKVAKFISDNNYSSLLEFNNYSYALSHRGHISMGFTVQNDFTVGHFDTGQPKRYMKNSNVVWFGPDGYYWYACQIICDYQRRLIRVNNAQYNLWWFNYWPDTDDCYLETAVTSNPNPENNPGVLLLFDYEMANEYPVNGQNFMLRLFRYRSTTNTCPVSPEKCVDIPLTGALKLFDNGLSVCGYKWQVFTGNVLTRCSQPLSVTFLGENVRCLVSSRIPSSNTGTGWKKGDVIINAGNETGWDIDVI